MTKTKNMNIQIADNDYEAIKKFADFNGKSISDLLLDTILEQIERWEDMKAISEYEQKKANKTLITSSWESVKKELGLSDEV